jgi:hypothetical protein
MYVLSCNDRSFYTILSMYVRVCSGAFCYVMLCYVISRSYMLSFVVYYCPQLAHLLFSSLHYCSSLLQPFLPQQFSLICSIPDPLHTLHPVMFCYLSRPQRVRVTGECYGDLGFVFGSVQIEKAARSARYRWVFWVFRVCVWECADPKGGMECALQVSV